MLKQLLLWMVVCVSGLLSAQEAVTIECRVDEAMKMNVDDRVYLYEVVKGRLVEKASGQYRNGRYFGFCFVPGYEGFYVLGDQNNYYYPVWIKAGDRVSVLLGKTVASLYGENNSPENQVLYAWLALSQQVCNFSTRSFLSRGITYPVFSDALEKLGVQAREFKGTIDTRNICFNELMRRYVDYQLDYYALNFLGTPKPQGFVWPETKDYSPFYGTILSDRKFCDTVVLQIPDGFRLLRQYANFAARMSEKSKGRNDLSVIPSPELQGELALEILGMTESGFQLRKLMKQYAGVFSAEQQLKADQILKALEEKNARQQTIDFTFQDVNGQEVSLSDFKGKVVVLDVWATWCGPCRAELPYLKKLEEEMEGTDLVVIGVSTDVKKDYAKWKKMVDEGEVKGVQLFANGGKSLRADYGVTGIPRFIVFDRDGKVVEAAAPRPSDPALKELLNELLKK